MTQRETVVSPLGLVTQPNKYGQYPDGAMSVAQNVVMRDPGIVEAMPAGTAVVALGALTLDYPFTRLWATPNRLLASRYDTQDPATDTNVAAWIQSNGTVSWITTAFSPVTYGWPAAIAHMAANNRYVLATSKGPLVMDSEGDTTARLFGMPRPGYIAVQTSTTTDAAVFANNKQARYVATFARKRSDGTWIEGAPSYAYVVVNTSGSTTDYTLRVLWNADLTTGSHLAAGDYVNLWRTDVTDSTTDPGATYYLAKTATLVAGDITAGYVDIKDTTVNDALGEEPYFNSGSFEPSDNGIVGKCSDAVSFKGYAFYAVPSLPPYFQFRANGNVGALSTDADRTNGIGSRAVTGDTHSNTTIDNISASHMKGLVVGQSITGSGIPANTTIATIAGATSITISQAATATAVGVSLTAYDRVQIGSTLFDVQSFTSLVSVGRDASTQPDIDLIGFSDSSATNASSLVYGPTISYSRPWYHLGSFTIKATNGANYSPKLPELSGTAADSTTDDRANRVLWSKLDEPEHVPPQNEIVIGSGTIRRMVATTDAVYVFASDGLYRIGGDGGVWQRDPVDVSLKLYSLNSVDVMQDTVWAYTNRGLVSVFGSTVNDGIASSVIADVLPGGDYTASILDTFVACDHKNREVWVSRYSSSVTTSYVYNTTTGAFTTARDDENATGQGYGWLRSAVYADFLGSFVWSAHQGDSFVTVYKYSASAYRVNTEVQFQPITGDGEPFSEKQWDDVTFMFSGMHASATINVLVNGSAAASDIAGTARDGETRFTAAVGRADACAPRIRYGFQVEDNESSGWSLLGFSTRWTYLGDEVKR